MEIQTRPAFVLRTYCIAQYLYLRPIHKMHNTLSILGESMRTP